MFTKKEILYHKIVWEIPRYVGGEDYVQREGVDYNDVFSLVVKYASIKILLALIMQYDLYLIHLNMKDNFAYGDGKENTCMNLSDGYKVGKKENLASTLKEILVYVEVVSAQRYEKFDQFIIRVYQMLS